MIDTTNPAADHQPAPRAGKQVVGDIVLADIRARMEAGKRRYGTLLQTHNGRDAMWDAYQEKIDDVFYTRQYLLERADTQAEINRLRAQVAALRRLVYVLRPLRLLLSEIVGMRDEIVDAWAEADRVMRNG